MRRSPIALTRRALGPALLLLILGPARAGAVELDDTQLNDPQRGLRLEMPEGWRLHRQTGYPSILALMFSEGTKASMSVAIDAMDPGEKLTTVVLRNRRGLAAVSLEVTGMKRRTVAGHAVIELKLRSRARNQQLRQLYLRHNRWALILTLSGPAKEAKQLAYAQDRLLELAELTRPKGDENAPRDAVSYPKGATMDDGATPPPDTPETNSRPNSGAVPPPSMGPPRPPAAPMPTAPGPTSAPTTQPQSAPVSRPAAPEQMQLEGFDNAP